MKTFLTTAALLALATAATAGNPDFAPRDANGVRIAATWNDGPDPAQTHGCDAFRNFELTASQLRQLRAASKCYMESHAGDDDETVVTVETGEAIDLTHVPEHKRARIAALEPGTRAYKKAERRYGSVQTTTTTVEQVSLDQGGRAYYGPTENGRWLSNR